MGRAVGKIDMKITIISYNLYYPRNMVISNQKERQLLFLFIRLVLTLTPSPETNGSVAKLGMVDPTPGNSGLSMGISGGATWL